MVQELEGGEGRRRASKIVSERGVKIGRKKDKLGGGITGATEDPRDFDKLDGDFAGVHVCCGWIWMGVVWLCRAVGERVRVRICKWRSYDEAGVQEEQFEVLA